MSWLNYIERIERKQLMKIKICDYSKKIKGSMILSNINLTFESGSIYGLKGTNGCGKTMLMRAIAGLILPTAGKVIIDGKEIGKDISFPENMGLLLEYPSFINGYSGLKNLEMIASIKNNISVDDVKACISRVGLDPDDKKPFRKYSLGMKQKLGIACAIMENPELLILDEPFNALDEKGISVIKDIIEEFRDNGAIVIMSCHDKELLCDISDVIIDMYEGKVTNES